MLGLLGTVALYAEGVLKSCWLEVFLLTPLLWVMVSPSFGPRQKGAMVAMVMTCVALVVCDLAGRPFADSYLHYSPAKMFSRKLPNLPILGRWDANVTYSGQAYGDLAAMKGEKEWREIREVVFQTDHPGFRNGKIHEPIDLIVLGDSFTAGTGTSQDEIFSQVLESSYGRSVRRSGASTIAHPGCGPSRNHTTRHGLDILVVGGCRSHRPTRAGPVWVVSAAPSAPPAARSAPRVYDSPATPLGVTGR